MTATRVQEVWQRIVKHFRANEKDITDGFDRRVLEAFSAEYERRLSSGWGP